MSNKNLVGFKLKHGPCESCAYYESKRCHRFPPIMSVEKPANIDDCSMWPLVPIYGGCGEYKPNEEPERSKKEPRWKPVP